MYFNLNFNLTNRRILVEMAKKHKLAKPASLKIVRKYKHKMYHKMIGKHMQYLRCTNRMMSKIVSFLN